MAKYLIAGGTSGIGLACVEQLSSNDEIYLISRNQEKAESLCKQHSNIKAFALCDLNDCRNVEKDLFEFIKENAPFDYFIYSAGFHKAFDTRRVNCHEHLQMMNVHYLSFVEMVKFILKTKKRDYNTSIVALSSTATNAYEKNNFAYIVAKSALDIYIKAEAENLLTYNIKINAIAPSFVETPLVKNWENRFNQPLGVLTPKEVALEIFHILNIKNTGSVFQLNAGWS